MSFERPWTTSLNLVIHPCAVATPQSLQNNRAYESLPVAEVPSPCATHEMYHRVRFSTPSPQLKRPISTSSSRNLFGVASQIQPSLTKAAASTYTLDASRAPCVRLIRHHLLFDL
jgi:hypothetical protein